MIAFRNIRFMMGNIPSEPTPCTHHFQERLAASNQCGLSSCAVLHAQERHHGFRHIDRNTYAKSFAGTRRGKKINAASKPEAAFLIQLEKLRGWREAFDGLLTQWLEKNSTVVHGENRQYIALLLLLGCSSMSRFL
jgi:hypothetical protein